MAAAQTQVGRVVEMVDGCDHWKPHPDGLPHGTCVTSRYKVRIIEPDEDGYYWAKVAG